MQLSKLQSDVVFHIDTGACWQHVYNSLPGHPAQEIQKAIEGLKVLGVVSEGPDSFLRVNWGDLRSTGFRYDPGLGVYVYGGVDP